MFQCVRQGHWQCLPIELDKLEVSVLVEIQTPESCALQAKKRDL